METYAHCGTRPWCRTLKKEVKKDMAQSFFGGIHPHDKKAATNKKPIEALPPPAQVVIPMSLHIGAPCRPCVTVGEHVNMGQQIGEMTAYVSAPIHASISGKVVAVEPRPHFNGTNVLSVVIENDYQDTLDPSVKPVEHPENLTAQELVEIVKNTGVVGLGGATFPTHVKIASGLGKVDTVIVNAAECEPYNTSDHRILLEYPDQVIGGAKLLARIFGVDKVHVGIEANKLNAAQLLQQRIQEEQAPVVVDVLHTRYPQGAEKQLCQSITGRQVPPGQLPAAIGCAVFSVDTTAAIWRAVYQGMPVIRRIVTVSGSGVMEPKNLECRIGTPLRDLLDFCGGVSETTFKLLMGGPMMGNAQYSADVPVGKCTNAILAFAKDEERTVEHPTCIRCGKCASVCPMRLQPLFLYLYQRKGMLEELEAGNVLDCIECGACAYICPGRLHLVQAMRTGKQQVNAARAAAKAKAEQKGGESA